MFYKLLAKILAIPFIVDWLLNRAQRSPYEHIMSADGSEVYMARWWLFNPYPGPGNYKVKHPWLPSIRVHLIRREDRDRHLHDHPWNARTFILWGYYAEHIDGLPGLHIRKRGDTVAIPYNRFHRIVSVSEGGVLTLFVTWKYRHKWGFKIPHAEYLAKERQS